MSDDTASPLNNVITIDDERIKRLSHERSDIAGAEGFHSLEGNMCGTAMRGADAMPGSKATSRAKGSHRNLGDLVSGRCGRVLSAEYSGPHREVIVLNLRKLPGTTALTMV